MSLQCDSSSHGVSSDSYRPNGSASRQNPFVFVVGCPRSGTTLLQRMLDHHPAMAVANDTHFIPRALKRTGTTCVGASGHDGEIPLTPALAEAVRTYHRTWRLGLAENDFRQATAGATTYAQFVRALYDRYAEIHGKRLAGEKTPDYARCLPLLHELFPQARFLHIVRDGRDVALSTLEWASADKGPGRLALWQEQPIAVCALWWVRQVSAARRDGARLGNRHYHEVRYESLVDQPETALRQITRFLDLPYVDEMLSFHVGRMKTDPALSPKKAWLPPTPGLRSWRDQLPDRDVELFEALAGEELVQFGYPRATQTVSPAIEQVAQRCRQWWIVNKTCETSTSSGVRTSNHSETIH